jgi:arylsulfatase A-like enzyme
MKFPFTLFLLSLLALSPVTASERPNVLLIVCDDLNMHVRPNGYATIQTLSIDALAAAGMPLTRAYCQYPVCGP